MVVFAAGSWVEGVSGLVGMMLLAAVLRPPSIHPVDVTFTRKGLGACLNM